MPSDISVGLVMGAEMVLPKVLACSPWDTVPTGIDSILDRHRKYSK